MVKTSKKKIQKASSKKSKSKSKTKLRSNSKKPKTNMDEKVSQIEHQKLTKILASNKGIEMYDIVNKLPKKFYIVKKDLKAMKNKSIKVVLFDRNFEEYGIWNDFDKYKLYEPKKFFKKNTASIKYIGGNTWNIKYSGGNQVCHYIEVNTVDIKSKRNDTTWAPIDDKGDVCCINSLKKVNFKDLPSNTRIGWRGPMILWSVIVNFDKKVYQADLNCIKNE